METNNAADPLREQLAIMRNSLFDEKMLNDDFRVLETLEDREQPNFAEQVMNSFFESSDETIAIFEQTLENPTSNFSEFERQLYRLKGSCSGVGACKVRIEADKLEKCIEERDLERAKIVVQQIKKERDTLELRLEPYFQLLRQVEPSRGSQRPKSLRDAN
ncbi:hypothetical protein TIFTF001_019779 [Ficus carica]|uniref:Histidine-containing phosphotransfer protein n=1 Tax=Ficus carica TaxID=3494 RepID=A0AA88A9I1_FICCA|nr:hypothetical protein TIFTF001_019779 [Ficus carica]